MVSKKRIQKSVEWYCENPTWKEIYNNTPTPQLQRYFALKFTCANEEPWWSKRRKNRIFKDYIAEAHKLEEGFSAYDWEYVLYYFGPCPFDVRCEERIAELKMKEDDEETARIRQSVIKRVEEEYEAACPPDSEKINRGPIRYFMEALTKNQVWGICYVRLAEKDQILGTLVKQRESDGGRVSSVYRAMRFIDERYAWEKEPKSDGSLTWNEVIR